jgi:hypothetical protein
MASACELPCLSSRRWFLVCFWLLLSLVAVSAHAQEEQRAGDWQQFVLANDGWHSLGVFRVQQNGSNFEMTEMSHTADATIPTKGLSNVLFGPGGWSFDSDWGNGDVGVFRLQRLVPGIYVGWSYLRETRRNYNMWLRVPPAGGTKPGQ